MTGGVPRRRGKRARSCERRESSLRPDTARLRPTAEDHGCADRADAGHGEKFGGSVLDEPAAALDPIGRRDVLRVMERLRERTTILYSTHILEDVERVSDTIAILAGGRLVTQAPTADLLAGASGRYTVSFRKAEAERLTEARHDLEARPWVKDITTTREHGITTWRVDACDENAADADLLTTVIRAGLPVESFGRERETLEDIFVDLIEGEDRKGTNHDD